METAPEKDETLQEVKTDTHIVSLIALMYIQREIISVHK